MKTKRTVIRQSLVKPLLLSGAEREPAILSFLFIFTIGLMSANIVIVVISVFVASLFHKLVLTRLAKHDSQSFKVYTRFNVYDSYYQARGLEVSNYNGNRR